MKLLSELRQGNYVVFNKQVAKVVEVRRDFAIVQLKDGTELVTKDISPLPFTIKIAEGFGFGIYHYKNGDGDGKFYELHLKVVPGMPGHNIHISFYPNTLPEARYRIGTQCGAREFHYVHELQNLFRYITKTELKFKQP